MSLGRKMVNSPNMANGPYSLVCLTGILYFVSCAEAFAFAVLFSYFVLCYMTLWSQIMKNIASTTSGLWPFVHQEQGKRNLPSNSTYFVNVFKDTFMKEVISYREGYFSRSKV